MESPLDRAKKLLGDMLSGGGSVPYQDVLRAGMAAGLTARTLRRAAARIGIHKELGADDWEWSLATTTEPVVQREVPRLEHVDPIIRGLTPDSRKPDPDELWARMISMEEKHRAKADARYNQKIEIPDDRPVLLVLLSDLHLGNAYCAYSQAKADAELIRNTPGVYGAVLGDVIDNWIGEPKIEAIQRQQPIPHAEELALLTSWLGILSPKLVAAVAGNHEARTYAQAGVDLIMDALHGVRTLYDQDEIQFTLRLANAEWRWKLRHAWRHKSQYNPTQGQEWDQKFNDGTWQFGVGGHWHGPTAFRDFYDGVHDHCQKLAIQLGSYEYDSSYARKLNLSHSPCGGSGAVMLWPDGGWQAWRDLGRAVRFLAAERARA